MSITVVVNTCTYRLTVFHRNSDVLKPIRKVERERERERERESLEG